MRIETPYQLEEVARKINGTAVAPNGTHRRDILDLREGDRRRPKIGSAAELRQRVFPDIPYVIPGIIAPGLTLLVGAPKCGKSWLCLDLLLAVSGDRYCLGAMKCEVGDVLYLALEDNDRRLRKRIAKLLPPNAEWPERLHYATQWPRADEGGLQEIRDWCVSVAKPRLIVVDVLAAFRTRSGGVKALYEADYAAIRELQQIASDFSVAIVVVHHTRKAAADIDKFDLVSGTHGLSGAADTTLVLFRDALGYRLNGRGRDVEEIDQVIEFKGESCRWYLRGEAAELRRSAEREAIEAVLSEADEPMSPAEIAGATGMPSNNIRQLLHKMCKDKEVLKKGRGRYIHPNRSDLDPDNTDNNAITNERIDD